MPSATAGPSYDIPLTRPVEFIKLVQKLQKLAGPTLEQEVKNLQDVIDALKAGCRKLEDAFAVYAAILT
ncbi:hypothetical protein D9611_009330 [Ephemerocybe angulata]|uniref:Uncharacterized protein n=1 Tax=Ephemerocybe angulata TaxID=980116 RepID=A0A8H5BI58_9AGAR|nr:hypothetical protein D9611_009330 [Tulosesus angulatus]